MFTARYELNLRVMYINPSKPSGLYTYHQFNIQQFYFLPTQSIYVCCVDLRTAIISIYIKKPLRSNILSNDPDVRQSMSSFDGPPASIVCYSGNR